MFAAIFWGIIVYMIIKSFGQFCDAQANIFNNNYYEREAQKIARKYDPTGYPKAQVARWKQGDEIYEQYNNEMNELRRNLGKLQFNPKTNEWY